MQNTRHNTLSQPANVILFQSDHLLSLNHTNKSDQYMELNCFNISKIQSLSNSSPQFTVYF